MSIPSLHVVANCLKLKAEPSKALSKRIVHFMSQTLPLVKYGLHTPAFHKEESHHSGKGEKEYADYESKNVSRSSTRGALQTSISSEDGRSSANAVKSCVYLESVTQIPRNRNLLFSLSELR